MWLGPALLLLVASAGAQTCPSLLGDGWPGALDDTASPPIWESVGDNRITMGDVLVAAQAAVSQFETDWLLTPSCSHDPGDVYPGWLDSSVQPPCWFPWGDGDHDLADVIALLRTAREREKQGESVTYYKDTKVIIDDKCSACHVENGLAPFPLTAWEEVRPMTGWMEEVVSEREMPPWPPSQDCAELEHSRALNEKDFATMMAWFALGAPEGNPDDEPDPRVKDPPPDFDLTLTMEESYTPPAGRQDDYRCFLMDWPYSDEKYITGFRTDPDKEPIAHHAIAYVAPPPFNLEAIQKDLADPAPGYECFGDSGVTAYWIGAWAPGELGTAYPEGTGLRMIPGSTVILQMHYNMDSSPPLPDQSSIEVMVADSVDRRAIYLPAPADDFFIPAGDPDVDYEKTWQVRDAIPDIVRLELGVGFNDPIAMYNVGLHMHLLGAETSTEILRADGSTDCLLDIHHWEFEWQGLYTLTEPLLIQPDDFLTLRCSWDNSPENQPIVNGEKQDPRDVMWGDRSTDEMCLGMYYIAAP